jgi:hypothetical protein
MRIVVTRSACICRSSVRRTGSCGDIRLFDHKWGLTVTGQIFGLASSGTSTPTDVVIDSVTASYVSGTNSPITYPFSTISYAVSTEDTFTVTGGEITNADYVAGRPNIEPPPYPNNAGGGFALE